MSLAAVDKGTDRTEILVVRVMEVVLGTAVATVGHVVAVAVAFIIVRDTGDPEAFQPHIHFFEVHLASADPKSTGEEGHIVVVAPSASTEEVVHITDLAPFGL